MRVETTWGVSLDSGRDSEAARASVADFTLAECRFDRLDCTILPARALAVNDRGGTDGVDGPACGLWQRWRQGNVDWLDTVWTTVLLSSEARRASATGETIRDRPRSMERWLLSGPAVVLGWTMSIVRGRWMGVERTTNLCDMVLLAELLRTHAEVRSD